MNSTRHASACLLLALVSICPIGCGAGDIAKPPSQPSVIDEAPTPAGPVLASFPIVLPDPGDVTLRIFDSEGHTVRVITVSFGSGVHEISWDGRNDAGFPVGSAVYVYRLELPGEEVILGRLVVAR